MFGKGVSVEQNEWPGMFLQRQFDLSDDVAQDRFEEGIEDVEKRGFVRKREIARVLTGRFDLEASLGWVVVSPYVLFGDGVEFWKNFDADDPAERIFGCKEQGAAFSGSHIDEGEVGVVDRDCGKHFVKLIGFYGLVRFAGKQFADSCAKADVGPGCVDVVVEIELKIAETQSAARGSRVA